MSCEQIWWSSSAEAMAVHISCPRLSSPPSTPTHTTMLWLRCLRHGGWCIKLSAWRMTHVSLLFQPTESFRHWGPGRQRSNRADLHHKGLSPVVLGINGMNLYQTRSSPFWLNATQTLTTHLDPSLGCRKHPFRHPEVSKWKHDFYVQAFGEFCVLLLFQNIYL